MTCTFPFILSFLLKFFWGEMKKEICRKYEWYSNTIHNIHKMNISKSRQVDPFNIDASHYFLKNFACDVYSVRGRQQESLIQRQFWESDTKLFLRIRYEIKHLQSRSPWFSFISYDELCNWMETNSQTWNAIRDQEKEIGFEENKYLLQLLGVWVHTVISRLPKNCLVWGEKFVMQASTNWGQNNSNTKLRLDHQTMVPP